MTFTSEEMFALSAAAAALGGVIMRYMPKLLASIRIHINGDESYKYLSKDAHEAICSPRLAELRVKLAAVAEHERLAMERVESIDKKIDLLLQNAMKE